MKKRVVSLMLAAALLISALAGCGSDSKESKSGSASKPVRDEGTSSAPLKEDDSGDGDGKSVSGASTDSDKKGGKSTESKEESTPAQLSEDAMNIARDALYQIEKYDTVEYSYMNTITCHINGTEASAETANQVIAYRAKDVAPGDGLTVSKESELVSGDQKLMHKKFWYDQNGNVFVSDYDAEAGGFVMWNRETSGAGLTWIHETGLNVYQEIADNNIKPTVLDSPDGNKHILYFDLDGKQTKSLFGRLIDHVSFNNTQVSLADAETVEVQVVVTRESCKPFALNIHAAGFETEGGISVTDYDISLAYTNGSVTDEPLVIPPEVSQTQ